MEAEVARQVAVLARVRRAAARVRRVRVVAAGGREEGQVRAAG